MRLRRAVRTVSTRGLTTLGWLMFLPPLLTRLLMGQAFYQTGSGKLAHMIVGRSWMRSAAWARRA